MSTASPARKRKTAAAAVKKPMRREEEPEEKIGKELPARRMRHRVMARGNYVFGPGKADVLEAIARMGSLAAAARSMKMSYMRAWLLVKGMQEEFAEPLVLLKTGGKTGGGAALTPAGEKALALYHQMEAEALAATHVTWRSFCQLLKKP